MRMIEFLNALFHLVVGGVKLSVGQSAPLTLQDLMLALGYVGIGICILLTLVVHWRRGRPPHRDR